MTRYDIAIIGTGPAGVSAAITARVRAKNILLLGQTELSEKLRAEHPIMNYPGLPGVKGTELAAAFLSHLAAHDITVTPDRVSSVYAMGDFFALQGASEMYEARTVILASGVTVAKPYPGEKKFLGRGVSYCATCDAALYKGKTIAVVGFTPDAEKETEFAAEFTAKIYYFPLYDNEVRLNTGVAEILRETPLRIAGETKANLLVTDACERVVDGIFLLRENIPAEQLVPGLEMENGSVKVNRRMETNLPGCFAAGDVTGAPYQFAKAVGEGNVAALSAAAYLGQR